MKVLITGGHLMPALAIIDRILSDKANYKAEVIFVGRKYNLDSEQSYSLEFKEISKRRIKFVPLITGRIKREISIKSLKNIFLIFIGLMNSLKIIKLEKPTIIFSFGGYLGFPFVFWGFLKKIPIYIHEQTLNPGLANRISGYFAKKVFVSFSQSRRYFSPKKTIVVGNPVRKNIFTVDKKPFTIDKKLPVVYVTGGSLGSHSLNVHIGKILPSLLADFIIIHQTGNVKQYDDYRKLMDIKKKLPVDLKKRYYLREHFFSNEIGYIFSATDLVVGRSGANTFFELIALKKPAILVPLPWSVHHEQQKQADLFASYGLGEVFSQFDKSKNLLIKIRRVFRNLSRYQNNFINLKVFYQPDAAEAIVQTIFQQ